MRDPLGIALARKNESGAEGATEGRQIAAGDGWRVLEILCTLGPRDRPFEERYASTSISLVTSGTFIARSHNGSSLMSPGAMLLGNAGHLYECSHPHGEGDRCLSFQFEPELFEGIAHDSGEPRARFDHNRVPPIPALAPLSARALVAESRRDSFEEIAYQLASAVLQAHRDGRRDAREPGARDHARIASILRHLESHAAEPHTLAELADTTGLSRYHFLRTFAMVTGVTPHQWLLRTRLREAARRVASTRDAITEIALNVGFDDLSNFIRSFRAEFGMSPSRHRSSGNKPAAPL